MDLSESTKVVFDRIQKIEPDIASKIIGYLLLKDYGDREMIRLAFGPDSAIFSLINEARAALPVMSLSSKTAVSSPLQPIGESPVQYAPYSRPTPSATALHIPSPYWELQITSERQASMHNVDSAPPYPNPIDDDYWLHSQARFMSLEEHLDSLSPMMSSLSNNYYYHEGDLSPRTSRRTLSLPNFPLKTCHYHYKGYCKHGAGCRYFHGEPSPDSISQAISSRSNDLSSNDRALPLEKLEIELTELLKSRGSQPISIAMLPMLYYEKFGKNLQADGYLTESQRHGKAGYSLTKLLARLKNIRILDRPHGQHSVMLAEDVSKHLEYRAERSDLGNVVSGSQQIYLTFPAESTFTEDDVSSYFKQYGPVQAVRIPAQQKRMFGFVTFVYPETVKLILAKGNPHHVCGARVLVKPYREKTRKYNERVENSMYYPSQYIEIDSGFHSILRFSDSSRFLRKQLIEDELMLEFQMRRMSELRLAPRQCVFQPFHGYGFEGTRLGEDANEMPSFDHFSRHLDALNNNSTNDDNTKHSSNATSDEDSAQIKLPDSPFASSVVGSSISTMI